MVPPRRPLPPIHPHPFRRLLHSTIRAPTSKNMTMLSRCSRCSSVCFIPCLCPHLCSATANSLPTPTRHSRVHATCSLLAHAVERSFSSMPTHVFVFQGAHISDVTGSANRCLSPRMPSILNMPSILFFCRCNSLYAMLFPQPLPPQPHHTELRQELTPSGATQVDGREQEL